MLATVWLTIPVLVFAFNHSPAISQFSVSLKRDYGSDAAEKADKILGRTATVLDGFTMLFVFSCVLALGPSQLAEAKAQNLPVLSYLANVHGSPVIAYFGPIIAFLAIVSSFFGHYLGATKGRHGIVRGQYDPDARKIADPALVKAIVVFMFLTTWGDLQPQHPRHHRDAGGAGDRGDPYLMPMYAIYKVPALAKYRGQISNVFVVVAGLIAMSGILYSMFG